MCCMIILSIHYQDKVAQNRRMPDAFSSQVERFFFAVLLRDANFTVDLYFLVSGFVSEISGNSQHSWEFHKCMKLLLKKLIRLAPIYYTCMILWLMVHYFLGVPCHVHTLTVVYHLFMVQAWPVFDLQKNITGSFAFAGYRSKDAAAVNGIRDFYHLPPGTECPPGSSIADPAEVNDPSWFVSCLVGIFVIHTLVAPILFSERATSTASRCALGAVCFCTARALQYDRWGPTDGLPIMWMYKWPPCAYCAFAAGGYTARLFHRLPQKCISTRAWLVVDLAIFVMWLKAIHVTVIAGFGHVDHNVLDSTQVLVCMFLLAACAKHKGLVLRFFSHQSLVSLGSISYAAYCVQGPVIDWMAEMYFDFNNYWTLCTYLFLTWTVGGFITTYIDEPVRNLLMRQFKARGWI